MLKTNSFYFATIRKLVVGFGCLFDNIKITRFSSKDDTGTRLKTIKVPISYGPKEKWYRIQTENRRAGTKTRIKTSFPRMSFELTNMTYDANRQLNKHMSVKKPNVMDPDLFLKQMQASPWDFAFDLHIGAKNMDDGLQIIEQILPYFQPSFNVPISIVPDLGQNMDVPIIFAGISHEDSYDGSFEDSRILTWTLSFVAKGGLYMPISGTDEGSLAVIKRVVTSIYGSVDMSLFDAPDRVMAEAGETISDEMTNLLTDEGRDDYTEKVTVEVNPLDAGPNDIYTIDTTIETKET